MSVDRLQSQLKGLAHESPLFRRQAAFGVFALLHARPGGLQAEQWRDAICTCLSSRHADVVEESVAQLQQLAAAGVPGLSADDALHLLLLALATAGAATASLLAAGAVPLLRRALNGAASAAAAGSPAAATAAAAAVAAKCPAGSRHPLCSALLSHPAAAPVVLTAAVNWLADALAAATPTELAAAAAAQPAPAGGTALAPAGELSCAWLALRPFFSFVLLADAAADAGGCADGSRVAAATAASAGAPGAGAGVSAACLAQLLCLASCDVGAARLLLPFLLRQLLLWRCDSASTRLAAAQALSDALDVLAAHGGSGDCGGDLAVRWWEVAASDAGRHLLLLYSRCLSPAAAGGAGAGAGGLRALLAPLAWRLGGALWPGVWRQQLLHLGWLLLCSTSQEEQALLSKLVLAQLEAPQEAGGSPQAGLLPWQAAALQLPLLQQLVFATGKPAKAWAAAALARLPPRPRQQEQQERKQQRPQEGFAALAQQGPLASLAAAEQLLSEWWDEAAPSGPLAWLRSLSGDLAQLGQGVTAPGGTGGAGADVRRPGGSALTVPLPPASAVRGLGDDDAAGGPASALASVGGCVWLGAQGVCPAAQLLLGALLAHPAAEVGAAAAGAVLQLVLLQPQLAPRFLPLSLQQLRLACRSAAGGGTAALGEAARAHALLGLLPAMCRDSSCAALVWRTLAPLLSAASAAAPAPHVKAPAAAAAAGQGPPQLARSIAVQLAVSAWKLTGRGWTRAEAAINGCIRPVGGTGAAAAASPALQAAADANAARALGAEPLELRLLRAAAAREAVELSASRGLELLGSLQDSLRDPAPQVAALGLSALRVLLDRDDLDFYRAWPLVARLLPPSRLLPLVGAPADEGAAGEGHAGAPPQHSASGLLVARWVELLSFGSMDALVAPEMAAAVIALMWRAAGAREAQVRAAAYGSLAAWPLVLLAQLEQPAEAAHYLQPIALEASGLAATLQQQQQQALLEASKAAVDTAEALAGVAVHHEHANRRQFLAAAAGSGATARAAGGGASGHSAAAAAEREELALRHRLARTLPQALIAGSAGGSGGSTAPAVQLLLWQPGASGGAGGRKAAEDVEAYAQVFADVSARWGGPAGGNAGGGVFAGHPGLAAAAWEAFMRRWLAAAGRVPDVLLPRLSATWEGGLPGPAAAALAAAAGLAAGGVLGEGQLEDLLRDVQRLLGAGGSRSSAVAAAAAAGLARLLPALHPADWTSREEVVGSLYSCLLDASGASGAEGSGGAGGGGAGEVLAAAAAEALASAGVATLQQHQQHGGALFAGGAAGGPDDRGLAIGCSCLGVLLSALVALWGAGGGGAGMRRLVDDALRRLPANLAGLVSLQELTGFGEEMASSVELTAVVLRGCCCLWAALASRAAALAAPEGGTARSGAAGATARAAAGAFCSGVLQLLGTVEPGPAGCAAARRVAVAAAAPAAAAAALASGALGQDGLAEAACEAQRVAAAATAPCSAEGRLAGAAAASWAALLCMRRAAAPASVANQELADAVTWLAAATEGPAPRAPAAAADGIAKLPLPPAASALRAGAATGLAMLLGVEVAAGSCGEWTGGLMAAAADSGAGAAAGALALTAAGPGGGAASASAWGLLGLHGSNTLQQLQLARACIKALEAAAALNGDGRGGGSGSGSASIAPLAGWLLAAAASAGRGGRLGAPAPVDPQPAVAPAAGGRAQAPSKGGGGAAAAAAPALTLYPPGGALRPLAEKALAFNPATALAQQQPSGLAAAFEAASCLRCLAAAPRLPAADWAGLCRRLLTAAPPPSAAPPAAAAAAVCQLQEAAAELLLAHGHVPSLELSGIADACLNATGFRQLPQHVQAALLQRLGTALAALPVNRAVGVLQGLPALLQELSATQQRQQQQQQQQRHRAAQPSAVAGQVDGAPLALCAWVGLGQLAQAAADRTAPMATGHGGLLAALHAAVLGLAAQLPPLPRGATHSQLLHAAAGQGAAAALEQRLERQQLLQAWGIAAPPAAAAGGGDDVASTGDTLLLWSAALSCFRLLNPDLGLKASAPPPPLPSAAPGAAGRQRQLLLALQFRSLLVLSRKLGWKELAECRHEFVALATGGEAQQALLPLALACATAPQAGLLQQLQELAAAAGEPGASPDNAAALAAAVLAAWLAAGSGPGPAGAGEGGAAAEGSSAAGATAAAAAAATEAQVALACGEARILPQLPAVLPQLLSCQQLLGSRQGFAEAVCSALLGIRARRGLSEGAALSLQAAVAAVREALPSGGSCWQELLLLASSG